MVVEHELHDGVGVVDLAVAQEVQRAQIAVRRRHRSGERASSYSGSRGRSNR